MMFHSICLRGCQFRFHILLSVVTQCLASWFSCQESFCIFDISCQDLGNYSWQGSQNFARFFKIVERNPRKFLDFLATKPKISKILAREPRKILDFLPRKFLDFLATKPKKDPKSWPENQKNLGFLAKKIFGFLRFIAQILAIIIGNVRKILQDFSRSWNEIQENSWSSWQQNQEYP